MPIKLALNHLADKLQWLRFALMLLFFCSNDHHNLPICLLYPELHCAGKQISTAKCTSNATLCKIQSHRSSVMVSSPLVRDSNSMIRIKAEMNK